MGMKSVLLVVLVVSVVQGLRVGESVYKKSGGRASSSTQEWITPKYVDKLVGHHQGYPLGGIAIPTQMGEAKDVLLEEKDMSRVHATRTVQLSEHVRASPVLMELALHTGTEVADANLPSNVKTNDGADDISPESYDMIMNLHGSVASDFKAAA